MNSHQIGPNALAGCLILVIDDVQDNLEITQELLEMNGATVITATNGREGLEMVSQHPDVIITDLAMPEMTGYELLQFLKDNRATAQIPVIALTGHAMDSYRTAAFEAGCHNFLIKPVLMETLLHEVLEVLQDAENLQSLPPS